MSMAICENRDHDGAEVPAVVIIASLPGRVTRRCAYCAEGYMTNLVRMGASFDVRPIDTRTGVCDA